MKYSSEVEIMKALGIESWRNLSKDKMIQFASMMPDMDREVALKIIEQFPEFTKFALEMLDTMEKRHESTLDHNQESQHNVHKAYQEIRQILESELHKADLSWEQRKYIIDLIMETGNREFEKDTENKQFLEDLLVAVAKVGVAAIVGAVVFAGGRAIVGGGSGGMIQPPNDGPRT